MHNLALGLWIIPTKKGFNLEWFPRSFCHTLWKKLRKPLFIATDPETFMDTSWYCQQAFHYNKLPPHNRQRTCHWILCQDVILRSIVRKFPECVMLFSTFTIFLHVAITLNSNERQTSLTLANLDRLLCFYHPEVTATAMSFPFQTGSFYCLIHCLAPTPTIFLFSSYCSDASQSDNE